MSPSASRFPIKVDAYEAYTRWAPSYDETPNPLTALEERLFTPILGDFHGSDIVDLGCGTGRWLRRLEAIGPRSLVGVDWSPAMLAEASKKSLLSTALVEADCTSTPLTASSADLVLASFVLSYLRDISRFAAEAARILRPGGTLIISDLHPSTRRYGWRRTFRVVDRLFEITTFSYTLADVHSATKAAGLRVEQMREAQFDEAEAEIFHANSMSEQFHRVQCLPVIFYARFVLVS